MKQQPTRPDTGSRTLAATLTLALLAACGCDDGAVRAAGTVLLEGAPAAGGRLTLTPVSGGERAFGMIDSAGRFDLRARDSSGVTPGSYRVSFRGKLDDKLRARLQQRSINIPNAGELTMVYESPQQATFDVPPEGAEDLQISISKSEGWQVFVSE